MFGGITYTDMNAPTAHHLPTHISPIELEWESIVALFHSSFRDTFARSKKAHFDFLPPDLRVIDGARDRWYPLLLLDAAWGLLWSNDYSFVSKKAFNQRKVLYDSIVETMQRTPCFPLKEDNLLFSPDLLSAFDWQTMPNIISSPTNDHSTSHRKQILQVINKDIVAFQRAEDAENLFPNLFTVFPSTEGLQSSSHSQRHLYRSQALRYAQRIPQCQENSKLRSSNPTHRILRDHLPITNRTCFSFPSPFNVKQHHQHINTFLTSNTTSTFCTISSSSHSKDISMGTSPTLEELEDGHISPWMTLAGFKRLALSDPPAKSRSRFEAAVAYLTNIATSDCVDVHVQQINNDNNNNNMDMYERELGELLHLVVCKVLLHQYCMHHISTEAEAYPHQRMEDDSFEFDDYNPSSSFDSYNQHNDNSSNRAYVANNANSMTSANNKILNNTVDVSSIWSNMVMEETLLDDWQQPSNNPSLNPSTNISTLPSVPTQLSLSSHHHSKHKRPRDESMLRFSPTHHYRNNNYNYYNDGNHHSDSEQEILSAFSKFKRRRVVYNETNVLNDLMEKFSDDVHLKAENEHMSDLMWSEMLWEDQDNSENKNFVQNSFMSEKAHGSCTAHEYLPGEDDEDSFLLFDVLSSPTSRSCC